MTIKKLYTNLYTFVDNLTKLRVVNKRKHELSLSSGIVKI